MPILRQGVGEGPPVTLRLSGKSKTLPLQDNSLVYVSLRGRRPDRDGAGQTGNRPLPRWKALEDQEAFVADGFSLSGSGSSVTYTSPERQRTLTCTKPSHGRGWIFWQQ